MVRVPLSVAACLIWLAGCATAPPFGDSTETPAAASFAVAVPPTSDGAVPLGSDPHDDLSLGKKHFRASNYGTAEQHFRKAVELHPKNAEAWVGLAAANDRLRRFDLADRAYQAAIRLLGETPEILNNQGYSYMLRGDYARARQILRKAQAHDPRNPYILNNLNLLEKMVRTGRTVG